MNCEPGISSTEEIEAFLAEHGGSAERLPAMLAFPEFPNPAKMILDSADTFPAQISSLLRVFDFEVWHESPARTRVARLTISDAELRRPVTTIGGTSVPDTPFAARASQRDYTCPIFVSARLSVTERKGEESRTHATEAHGLYLGDVPQVVRGSNCVTAGLSAADLEMCGESAIDPGGYVILKGNPTAVRIMEFLIYNQFTVYLHTNRPERAQGQVISKRGDAYENSAQIVIRILTSGEITVEMAYPPFNGVQFPFYLLYRMLGVSSDARILELVLYSVADRSRQTEELRALVVEALRPPAPGDPWYGPWEATDPARIMAYLGWRALRPRTEGTRVSWGAFVDTSIEEANSSADLTRRHLSKHFLPHTGDTSGDADYPAKLHHFTYYLRRVLLTLVGVIPPTDRESYSHKRWQPVEVQWSKLIKTIVNGSVIKPAQAQLHKLLEATPHAKEITVQALLDPLLPAPALAASISKEMQRAEKPSGDGIPAVMSTERITPKNALSGIVAVRTVRSPGNVSKQTSRADLQRRVHGTYPGTICPIRSAESGEQVGMNKGPACLAVISVASSSAELQAAVANDAMLVSMADTDADPSRIIREHLSPVLVNGLIIGYIASPIEFSRRWQAARRRGIIDRRVTVQLEPITGELAFFSDFGRPLFPYVVVNHAGEGDDFRQWPAVSRAELLGLLAGTVTVRELEQRGCIEYLSAGEVLSLCYVATSVEELARRQRDPCHRFTHCLFHPASIFSHSALSCVYPAHSAQARNTYQCQQGKGAQGVTFTNPHQQFAHGGGKHQPYIHQPIINTITGSVFCPVGQNAIVAVLASTGHNMEDSCIIKRQAVERGFFNLYFFDPYEATLKSSAMWANPVQRRTVAPIPDANYEYLDEQGLIRLGSPVSDGTVLIGMLETVSDGSTQTLIDRSVVYRGPDRGVVAAVVDPRASSDTRHCKVLVLSPRHAAAGEKVAARSGNKAIICAVMDEWQLPYSRDGVRPDLIMSPLSFPTRMVINQLVEAAQGMVCARRGTTADATAFNSTATEELYAELLEIARADITNSPDPDATAWALFMDAADAVMRYSLEDDQIRSRFSGLGTCEMFDAATGVTLRGITMTPLMMRRLAKFAKDDAYAVGRGAQNVATRQPAGGKRRRGGLKFGEMEREVLKSHGETIFMSEKLYEDSSGMYLHLCTRCRQLTGFVNESLDFWSCPRCDSAADVQRIASDWGTNVLQHTLHCMGIGMEFIPAPIEIPQEPPANFAAEFGGFE